MLLFYIVALSLWVPSLCAKQTVSLEELDHVSLSRTVSQDKKSKSREQILKVIKNIRYENMLNITFKLPLDRKGGTYLPFNASILLKSGEGYDLVCRTRTKDHQNDKNYFLRFDSNFKLIKQQEIAVPEHVSKDIVHRDRPVVDARLFCWKNILWLTGWSYMKDTKIQKFAVGKLNTPCGEIPSAFDSVTMFKGPDLHRYEKNWMQVINGDSLLFIYSYDPFILLAPNLENGRYEKKLTYVGSDQICW